MSIKAAIFALESVAHLQGKERTLLPVVESARTEHQHLLSALQEIARYKGTTCGTIAANALRDLTPKGDF